LIKSVLKQLGLRPSN